MQDFQLGTTVNVQARVTNLAGTQPVASGVVELTCFVYDRYNVARVSGVLMVDTGDNGVHYLNIGTTTSWPQGRYITQITFTDADNNPVRYRRADFELRDTLV